MSTMTPPTNDDRIVSPMKKLRGMIRTYVSLEGLATVGLFLALWFWVGLVIDYGVFRAFRWDWVQEVPWSARATVLGLVVAALIALLLTRILMRVMRDFSQQSLALVLERKFPKALGDRLITAVELADVDKAATYGYSPDMIRKTIADVSARMDRVPVKNVFNWGRLYTQGALVLGVTAGVLLVVFGAGAAYQKLSGRGTVGEFASHSADVGLIWAERNVLLRDTPWPRNVYLEMPDFNGDELRVGRDGAAPRLRVVALKWVIADQSVPDGWRAMTWGEVTPEMLGGETKPELPIDLLAVASKQFAYGAAGMGASPVPFTAYLNAILKPGDAGLRLPADLPETPEELDGWRVDLVEKTFLDSPDIRAYLNHNLVNDEMLAVEAAFTRLRDYGTDVANSRTVRHLTLPQKVHLTYWGAKTDNEMDLERTREGDSEYVGTLSDLKESVKVKATAGDYATATKRITLVPPPQLEIFERDEYRPAYIYHRPPVDTKFDGLRGLRQEMPGLGISRSGERSRFEIPTGTDLVIRGSADKPLTKARLVPKAGKFPGPDAEAPPVDLKLSEGERQFFEFAFVGPMRVVKPCEFDLEFTDEDNVISKRGVQIVPVEDKVPEVDVVIEVIRKVGTTYMCTPRAYVPIVKDSRVRDDHGLNRVDYKFSYRQLDSQGVVNTRATIAGGLLLGAPGVPNLGSLVYGPVFVESYRPVLAPTQLKEFNRIETLEGFTELMKERAPDDVVERILKERLKQPNVDGRVVREFDFKLSEAFDLQKHLPDIDIKDESKYQPRYTINLTVTATDTNVEAKGAPEGRTADNNETFTLTVVSEADLLAEISKEEEGLIAKLEEVVVRLKDAYAKLNGIVDRLPNQKPEDMLADSTQANTIAETCAKCRDMTQDLLKDYQRILKEYQVNRMNKRLIEKLDAQIVTPLDSVIRIDFPALDEPLIAFNAAFGEQRKPDQVVAEQTRDKLRVVVEKLSRIRDGVGEIVDIKKVIALIQNVLKIQETEIKAKLDEWKKIVLDQDLKGLILPPTPVTVTNLQKAKGKLEMKFGLESEDSVILKFEVAANSELKLPSELKVDAPLDLTNKPVTVEFEITAGTKKGDFPIKVTRSDGVPPVTLVVTVK